MCEIISLGFKVLKSHRLEIIDFEYIMLNSALIYPKIDFGLWNLNILANLIILFNVFL